MAIPFTNAKDPNAAKKAAAEAARNKAAKKEDAIMVYVSPEKCKDRMRVVFDDSGSMGSYIDTAKDGVVEFFRWCAPNQSACGMNFLNTKDEAMEKLTSDLPNLGMLIKARNLRSGATPLFHTMMEAVEDSLITRMIAFTDGSPTDEILSSEESESWRRTNTLYDNDYSLRRWKANADKIIVKALEKKVPIDTVFFGAENNKNEIALLKYFSDSTGGYFLHFDPAKVNFARAFKYLAPTNRLMLASESVRREIESGVRS